MDDLEQKKRERLRKQAEQERIGLPKLPKMTIDGVEFDMNHSGTRLIGKTPPFIVGWDMPKKEEVYELYWRTKDGSYFVSLTTGYVLRLETKTVHDLLNIGTSDYQWFLTEAEKKGLKQDDERPNWEK